MSYIIIGILIIGGLIWLLSAILEGLSGMFKVAEKKINKMTQPTDNRSLIERNSEIISKCVGDVYASDYSYYVENEVCSCLRKIAENEDRSDLSPAYREWLSKWENRTDIPSDWLELKDHIKNLIKGKLDVLITEKEAREARREKEAKEKTAKASMKVYNKNKDIIDKFLEIAERNVSVIDDYGDENWDVLEEEIRACVGKIARKEGVEVYEVKDYLKEGNAYNLGEEYEWLEERLDEDFRKYHDLRKGKIINADLNGLTGVEFETHIAKILSQHGFSVQGTPATGDQGCDLIAKKDGKKIIIQAKRYQGTVGNKAVQEVISAVGYYDGDEGWVITNSSFTLSAKALAHKSNIKLVDGFHLSELTEIVSKESANISSKND